jgi:hypothetical protein
MRERERERAREKEEVSSPDRGKRNNEEEGRTRK